MRNGPGDKPGKSGIVSGTISPAMQVTAGASMISFSAVFVKLAHVGPTAAGFYRMLFGSAILVVILIVARRRISWRSGSILWLALCGFLFAVDLSVWHRSIQYLGPGLSTLLGNFQVFLMAAWGVFFLGEKLGWRLFMAIPSAVLGLFMIFGFDLSTLKGDYGLGVLFGLLTAVSYSVYLLALRKSQKTAGAPGPMASMAVVSLLAALFNGAGSWALGESFFIPDLQSWVALVLYGLFGQVLGWVLITRGIHKIEASRAGLILLLQPALALVWDYLFFAKPVFPLEVVGVLIVLYAIYLGAGGKHEPAQPSKRGPTDYNLLDR
jgi:drug/metabolite transporter (DMT)-like permease